MLFSLTLTDCLILGLVIVLIILISYFSIYKKKDDPCKGCPYAMRTLKEGVEHILKTYIPEVKEVRNVEDKDA